MGNRPLISIFAYLIGGAMAAAQTGALTIDPSNGRILAPTTLKIPSAFTFQAESAATIQLDSGSTLTLNGTVTPNATARSGLGSMRSGFANSAAALAATPDFDGQIITTTDGVISLGTGTAAGNVSPFAQVSGGTIYMLQNTVWTGFSLNADTQGANGAHRFTASGGTFIDNVAYYKNTTGGYSAAVFVDPDGSIDGNGPAGTIGVGPATATNGYAHNLFIATNPHSATPANAPGDIILKTERHDVANYAAHERIRIGGATKDIVLRGYTDDVQEGPVGIYVDAAGNVGVRTNSLTAGKELTVSGDIEATSLSLATPLAVASGGTGVASLPKFSVHKGGSNQTIATGTTTLVTWSTEDYDEGSGVSSNRFVAPVAGKYQFTGVIYFDDTVDGNVYDVQLYKNGSLFILAAKARSATNGIAIPFSQQVSLSATDYVEVYVAHNKGSDATLAGSSQLTRWQGAYMP